LFGWRAEISRTLTAINTAGDQQRQKKVESFLVRRIEVWKETNLVNVSLKQQVGRWKSGVETKCAL
jgi:hypothetical protein